MILNLTGNSPLIRLLTAYLPKFLMLLGNANALCFAIKVYLYISLDRLMQHFDIDLAFHNILQDYEMKVNANNRDFLPLKMEKGCIIVC